MNERRATNARCSSLLKAGLNDEQQMLVIRRRWLAMAGWEQERMKKPTPDDPGWVVARAMGIAVICLLLSTFKLVTIKQRRNEKYQTTCLTSFGPGLVDAAHFKRSLCCQKKRGNGANSITCTIFVRISF